METGVEPLELTSKMPDKHPTAAPLAEAGRPTYRLRYPTLQDGRDLQIMSFAGLYL